MRLLLSYAVLVWTVLSLDVAAGFAQQQNSHPGCHHQNRISTSLFGYSYSSAQPFGDNAPNHQPGGGYRYSPSPEWEYLGSAIDRDAIDRLRPNNAPMPSAQQQQQSMSKSASYGYTPTTQIGDNAAALARNYAHVAPSWEYQGPARDRQVGSVAEASRMLGMGGSSVAATGAGALPPSAGFSSNKVEIPTLFVKKTEEERKKMVAAQKIVPLESTSAWEKVCEFVLGI